MVRMGQKIRRRCGGSCCSAACSSCLLSVKLAASCLCPSFAFADLFHLSFVPIPLWKEAFPAISFHLPPISPVRAIFKRRYSQLPPPSRHSITRSIFLFFGVRIIFLMTMTEFGSTTPLAPRHGRTDPHPHRTATATATTTSLMRSQIL